MSLVCRFAYVSSCRPILILDVDVLPVHGDSVTPLLLNSELVPANSILYRLQPLPPTLPQPLLRALYQRQGKGNMKREWPGTSNHTWSDRPLPTCKTSIVVIAIHDKNLTTPSQLQGRFAPPPVQNKKLPW